MKIKNWTIRVYSTLPELIGGFIAFLASSLPKHSRCAVGGNVTFSIRPVASVSSSFPQAAADPELDALKLRVVWMESRVFDLEARKIEMDKLLELLAFQQYQALGELLAEQLCLQQEVLRRRAERSACKEDELAAQAAAEEYAAYQGACRDAPAQQVVLASNEQDELKALYRAAAMRCHPDRVDDEGKDEAHVLFLRIQEAYRTHDLAAMRLISHQLEAHEKSSPNSANMSSLSRLHAFLDELEDKGVEIALAIQSIQMSSEYHLARRRDDWPAHFASLRRALEDDCAALRRELVFV